MYEKIVENVRVEDFAQKLELEILCKGSKDYLELSTTNIARPGLQLTGFYGHFPKERVQIMGEMECSYLATLQESERLARIDKLFSFAVPCVIFSTGLIPQEYILQAAQRHGRALMVSKKRSSLLTNDIVMYLNDVLAPTETRHGVLLDLYGMGVMLIGNSGVGKSETALELVQRGHRLVADDAVVIKKTDDKLTGSSPPVIRYLMEIRGIGIIDVRNMYGMGAIINSKTIDLLVELENWDENKEYDRLGVNQDYAEILGVKMPKIIIPIKPGRNLAVILEVAARSHRLKSLGFSALEELDRRMKS